MKKKKDKKLFLVDTIVTYRMRYVIEAKELPHAFDEVTMIDSGNPEDSFSEFSQKYIGEDILDGREISMKEFDVLLSTDKECSHWMGKKLIRKINYKD